MLTTPIDLVAKLNEGVDKDKGQRSSEYGQNGDLSGGPTVSSPIDIDQAIKKVLDEVYATEGDVFEYERVGEMGGFIDFSENEGSLRDMMKELIRNALDEQQGGKIRIRLELNNKAYFSVSNGGKIAWGKLRRKAIEYADNGDLIQHRNGLMEIYDRQRGLNERDKECSVSEGDAVFLTAEDVDSLSKEELLFILGLSLKNDGNLRGHSGRALAVIKRVMDKNGQLHIKARDQETTFTLEFNVSKKQSQLSNDINDQEDDSSASPVVKEEKITKKNTSTLIK